MCIYFMVSRLYIVRDKSIKWGKSLPASNYYTLIRTFILKFCCRRNVNTLINVSLYVIVMNIIVNYFKTNS